MIEKNRDYTQKECLYLCEKLKYKEVNPCNFSLDDLDEDIYRKAEDLDKMISDCIGKFFKESKTYELCSNLYCPLECDSYAYDLSLNSHTITGYGNISKMNDSFYMFNTFENVSKSFYALRVYYEDLKYTLIEQKPKIELFGLISNVGGTLGLFLGFSFISLLELINLVLNFYMKLITRLFNLME